jgi:hypothetical protein
MPVFLVGIGQVAAYCPVCRQGVVLIRFIQPSGFGPATEIEVDVCSIGCLPQRIFEALRD